MTKKEPIVLNVIRSAYDQCETPAELLNLTASSPCIVVSLFMTTYMTIMNAEGGNGVTESMKLATIETLRVRMRETMGVMWQIVNSANPEVAVEALGPELVTQHEGYTREVANGRIQRKKG